MVLRVCPLPQLIRADDGRGGRFRVLLACPANSEMDVAIRVAQVEAAIIFDCDVRSQLALFS